MYTSLLSPDYEQTCIFHMQPAHYHRCQGSVQKTLFEINCMSGVDLLLVGTVSASTRAVVQPFVLLLVCTVVSVVYSVHVKCPVPVETTAKFNSRRTTMSYMSR